MAVTNLCYGIPDMVFPRVDGGEINPSKLIGHDFVIFFCPSESRAANVEIEDYRARSKDFEKAGVWLIGVLTDDAGDQPEDPAGTPHLPVAHDPEGLGWLAFQSLLEPGEFSEKADGGTFLFARGGCLVRAWAGSGHAADALGELRIRN